MNASFLNNSSQNRKSSNTQSDSQKQTERQKSDSFGGKSMINKIGQSYTKCKWDYDTGVTNNHGLFGFIF